MIRKDYLDITILLLLIFNFLLLYIGFSSWLEFQDYILGSIITMTSFGYFVFYALYEIGIIIIEKQIQNYRGGRHNPKIIIPIYLMVIILMPILAITLIIGLIFPLNPWFFIFLMVYFILFPLTSLLGMLKLRQYLKNPKIIYIIKHYDALKSKQLLLHDGENEIKRILKYDVRKGTRDPLVIENSYLLPKYFWLIKVKKKVYFKNLSNRIRFIGLKSSSNIVIENCIIRYIKLFSSKININESKIKRFKAYHSSDSTISNSYFNKIVLKYCKNILIENSFINKLKLKDNQGCEFINCNIVQLKTTKYIENEFKHSNIKEIETIKR